MKKAINVKPAILIMLLAIFMLPANAQNRQGQGQGQGQGQMQRQGPGQRQGQGFRGTEEDVKTRMSTLAEQLELSDEQSKTLLDFELVEFKKNQARREQMAADREAGTMDREAMRANMTKARELRDKKYKEVMTEEQYAKYTKMREERMQQRRNNQGTPGQQGQRPSRGRGR